MAYPGTFLSIQDSVMGKLRLKSAADRDRVKDWINQTYADVCVETEALQNDEDVTLTAGANCYTIDTDIIRFKMITAQQSGGGYGGALESTSIDDLLDLRRGDPATTGTVAKYALLGMNKIHFWPTPTDATVLILYYVYLPTALAAAGDVPVLQEPWASKVLEYGALYEGSQYLQDPNLGLYREEYQVWMRRFRAHLNRREGGPVEALRVSGMRGYAPARDVDYGYC